MYNNLLPPPQEKPEYVIPYLECNVEYTPEQWRDIAVLCATRAWNEAGPFTGPRYKPMTGKCVDILIIYLMSGTTVDHQLMSEYGFDTVINFLRICPPWIVEKVTPIVAAWKAQAFKDPDFAQMSA